MRQKQVFVKRMDQDADPRLINQGQYRSARNARVGTSNTGNEGATESMQSNLLISGGYSFGAGTNKCIGIAADTKNNALIYCYFNSNGNHRIIHWDSDTGVFTNILPTAWNVTALPWTANTRLWNTRIIENGTDQILFFHDVQGVPMRINLNIRNLRPGTYTLTIDDITVARRPPHLSPAFTFATDTAKPSSFLQNLFFQFRYCFVYEDDEISTWSPWSEISIQPQDGVFYNKIVVQFNSGPKGVVKVKIARRIGNGISDTGSNNPELYVFNTWEKGVNADNTNFTVDFFNTEVLKAVSVVESARNFSQVPILVGAQEIVESNQVVYFDITEGRDNLAAQNVALNTTYDQTGVKQLVSTADGLGNHRFLIDSGFVPNVGDYIYVSGTLYGSEIIEVLDNDPDVIASYIVRAINSMYLFGVTSSSAANLVTTNIPFTTKLYCISRPVSFEKETLNGTVYNKTNAAQTINSSSITAIEYNDVQANNILKVNLTTFKFLSQNQQAYVTINVNFELAGGGGTYIYIIDATDNSIISRYDINLSSPPYSGSVNFVFLLESLVGRSLAIAYSTSSGSTTTTGVNSVAISFKYLNTLLSKGFKSGSTHEFSLVYFDQYMRQSGAQVPQKVYVPFPNQRVWQQSYNKDGDLIGFIPQIDWEIKHLPPSWAYYYAWSYNGGSVKDYAQFVAVSDDVLTAVSGGNVKVSTRNLAKYQYLYPSFSAGDRVRILGLVDSLLSRNTVFYTEGVVFSISSTEIVFTLEDEIYDYDKFLIEIFSVNYSELTFEQNVYTIGNPGLSNRFHSGPVQNQNPADPIATPAKGDFIGSTYFHIIPNYLGDNDNSTQSDILIEASSISVFAESNYWNKGRVHIQTPEQKQERTPWLFRWGNQLLQNSQVNGISMFDSGNFKILRAKYGAITGAREVGYTLKIIQESNYSTAFIGRRELQNADGSSQLVVSDGLIGTINPSESLYGSKKPGSILSNGRDLYWIDTIRRKVVRESGNAPFPISDYGMSQYWINACALIESLNQEVITGFDRQTESLFITRKLDNAHITLSFYDPEKESEEPGWISEHSFDKTITGVFYPIDMYGWVGQVFATTLRDGIYRHNQAGYLNLYGEQKTFAIQSVFNPEFDTEKVFLGHWVKCNRPFTRSTFICPVSAQNPNGMRTYLLPGNYKVREAQYFSDLKNDGYTKGLVAENALQFVQQMVSGRPMREQYILAEIEYSGDLQFVIISHDIVWEGSPWT